VVVSPASRRSRGISPGQGRELVDHDHQPGQDLVPGLAATSFGVFLYVLRPGGGQHFSPAGQLGGQAALLFDGTDPAGKPAR